LSESWTGSPKSFPANFVTQRRTLLFRTAQGTKLFSAVMNDQVAFEAEDHTAAEGGPSSLSATAEILEAKEARLLPWTATLKPLYVRDWVAQQR
jgi:hypothetical protein